MADKLKMGFIGLGFVGPQHADGVALNWDIATAYAVADDDPAKQEMAKKMGLKTYDKAEEMIAFLPADGCVTYFINNHQTGFVIAPSPVASI